MKNNDWLKLLYNPFSRIAGWKAFGIGAVIVAVSVYIACATGNYFSGAMNIRYIGPSATLLPAFMLQIQGLLCMVALMYVAGLIFSKGVRFQDVLGTVTLSRYPYLFAAIACFLVKDIDMKSFVQNITQAATNQTLGISHEFINVIIFGLILLVLVVWYIALLYNAFRVSTDIKGAKGIVIFIVTLILTDILNLLIFSLITSKFI
ncbi:hypothetical protein M2132_000769 [Dysgonomonas sp. PH5-45]|uniref:YIP1 family protein n=1 Tax=unclassified Dysgonomonas TaxID=2630389 RepID=UPI002474CEAA|nr:MULTISPECIES: YIP1 family protein [unclassified Dysgonomonas]MDH6354441.1 hypothetical protein [Dysgonomonas sp. PH5-45]MDH6387340.1 hypothetical protein [Dysgonomonas sp. PH5-37]